MYLFLDSSTYATFLFNAFDTDHDGSVSFEVRFHVLIYLYVSPYNTKLKATVPTLIYYVYMCACVRARTHKHTHTAIKKQKQ